MAGAGDDARWVRAAARNNAELCDLVSRGHGAVGAFGADAWTCSRRAPALYPDAAWSSLRGEVAGRFPELAIVGYESGVALEVALRAGFRSIGPLRVWIKE